MAYEGHRLVQTEPKGVITRKRDLGSDDRPARNGAEEGTHVGCARQFDENLLSGRSLDLVGKKEVHDGLDR